MAPQGTWCPQGAFKSWVKLTSIYIDHIVSDMLQEKTKPSNTLPDFFGIESLLKHPACVWFAGAGPCGAINHLDWDPFKELGGQNALFWKAQGSDLSVYDFKSQRVSEDSTTVLPSQNIIFYCPHYHPVSWCIIRIPSYYIYHRPPFLSSLYPSVSHVALLAAGHHTVRLRGDLCGAGRGNSCVPGIQLPLCPTGSPLHGWQQRWW